MFDWNDLKYLLAVARHQGSAAASRALGVSQSTVQRHPSGYRLTSFGEQLLPLAQQVELSVVALTQRIEAFQNDVTGVVWLTCPEPLVYRISKSTLLERFHAHYPGLQVEFVTSDKYLDFANGEVDIALRSGDTQDNAGGSQGRRLLMGGIRQPQVHRTARPTQWRGRS
jgi:DNA-binding transcriptional LysR family regulator